jgi:hypothetical protein
MAEHPSRQPYAGLTDEQAYDMAAKGDAALQAKMLQAGSGANNEIIAALNRAGVSTVVVSGFINSIAPTWAANPQGQPVDVNGNPVSPLSFPPYVPKGPRPTHGGKHTGQNQ